MLPDRGDAPLAPNCEHGGVAFKCELCNPRPTPDPEPDRDDREGMRNPPEKRR